MKDYQIVFTVRERTRGSNEGTLINTVSQTGYFHVDYYGHVDITHSDFKEVLDSNNIS